MPLAFNQINSAGYRHKTDPLQLLLSVTQDTHNAHDLSNARPSLIDKKTAAEAAGHKKGFSMGEVREGKLRVESGGLDPHLSPLKTLQSLILSAHRLHQ